jgi:hypothetical protein
MDMSSIRSVCVIELIISNRNSSNGDYEIEVTTIPFLLRVI